MVSEIERHQVQAVASKPVPEEQSRLSIEQIVKQLHQLSTELSEYSANAQKTFDGINKAFSYEEHLETVDKIGKALKVYDYELAISITDELINLIERERESND